MLSNIAISQKDNKFKIKNQIVNNPWWVLAVQPKNRRILEISYLCMNQNKGSKYNLQNGKEYSQNMNSGI